VAAFDPSSADGSTVLDTSKRLIFVGAFGYYWSMKVEGRGERKEAKACENDKKRRQPG
jgi:hypothetical protein